MSSFTNSDDETGISVHETISAPHESTTGVIASLVEPTLGDKDSYIDQEEYTNLLQDRGTPIEDGPTKCPNKVFQFKGHRCKDIWKLADMLKKLYETKKWHGAPRNGSNLRKYIAAHIITHRNPVKKGDVSVFGHSKELVAIAQASSSADETASLFYSLEQKAKENETNESIKRMRVNIADKTIWTLYQEINTASDAVNSEMGTD